jgi:hypothetical protein
MIGSYNVILCEASRRVVPGLCLMGNSMSADGFVGLEI